MKNNRKSPFLSNFATFGVQTNEGIKSIPVISYVRFNDFLDSSNDTGSLIQDYNSTQSSYEIVEGIPSAAGEYSKSSGDLSDFNIYGETVYADIRLQNHVGMTLPLTQKGFSLPIGGSSGGTALDRRFLVKKDAENLNPANVGLGLTYMLKIKLGQNLNEQSILTIGDKSGISAFTIAVSNSSTKEITVTHHSTAAVGDHASQIINAGISDLNDEWLTIFVKPAVSDIDVPLLYTTKTYRTRDAKLCETSLADIATSGTSVPLENESIYIGYGEVTGGVNVDFMLSDFLVGVDIAELAVFYGILSDEEIDAIARSHLRENHYKTGINSRAPRKVQQILDAQNSYPVSAVPFEPGETSQAFNDQFTKVFGQEEDLMFPDMLPARLFSGSTEGRGAEGDSRYFYRDIHQTEYEKRLVAPGVLRSGLSNKETELLDLSVRNSPVSISKDTALLGGNIEPFNDNDPLADVYAQEAVSGEVYPGLQQKLGDHVRIVIELNPEEDTTIGVERDGNGIPTGRVTSMAYYNFKTKKWETSGENNDFVVPGNVTLNAAIDYVNGENIVRAMIESSSVGFTGTSGFSIYEGSADPLSPLSFRGNPTSNYGFPIEKKYEAKDDQLIDVSRYLSDPLILEKIEFDFGAAIEDSGPHALGYKVKNHDSLATVGGSLPYLQYNMSDVEGCYLGLENLESFSGLSHNAFSGVGTQYNFHVNNFLNRSEFINGSPVIPFQDLYRNVFELTPEQTGTGTETYVKILPFASASAWPLYSICRQESTAYSYAHFPFSLDPIGPYVFSNNLVKNLSNSFDGYSNLDAIFKYFYYSEITDLEPFIDYSPFAKIMLKAGSSPRQNDNELTKSYRKLPRETINDLDSFSEQDVFINYIPVLAGGMNGLVTGSYYKNDIRNSIAAQWGGIEDENVKVDGSTNIPYPFVELSDFNVVGAGGYIFRPQTVMYFGGPSLFVESNKNNTKDSQYLLENHYESEDSGTPFWRADTFFLMRQRKFSSSRTLQKDIKFNVTADSPVYTPVPILPDATADLVAIMATSNGIGQSWTFSDDKFVLSTPLDIENSHVLSVKACDVISSDAKPYFGVTAASSLYLELEESDTTRELITYGQMTHYGYVNASQPFVDKITDLTLSEAELTSYYSGSLNEEFKEQIWDSSGNPKDTVLFGQAIKLSAAPTPASLLIPGTVLAPELSAEPTSAFSDFPDTVQCAASNVGNFSKHHVTSSVQNSQVRYSGAGTEDKLLMRSGRYASSSSYVDPEMGWKIRPYRSIDTFGARTFEGNPVLSGAQGSGMSFISTPAYFCEKPTSYNTVSDFYKYGTFENAGSSTDKSWLDAGLGKELNIFLQKGYEHEGTNIDFDDSFSGFTLMTASHIEKPFVPLGRESASQPIVANVYKRQYINYDKEFKLVAPVKKSNFSRVESEGFWTTKWNVPYVAYAEMVFWTFYNYAEFSGGDVEAAYADNMLSNAASRFNYDFKFKILDTGYTDGVNLDRMPHGRWIVKGAGATKDKDQKIRSSLIPYADKTAPFYDESRSENNFVGWKWAPSQQSGIYWDLGAPQLSKYGEFETDIFHEENTWQETTDTTLDIPLPDKTEHEALYVLKPGDKLVVGCQPSLPGWNIGSNLPNNRPATRFGVWDYSGSYYNNPTPGIPQAHDWDTATHDVKEAQFLNLVDPYEPCHGLTMLKGPSRVVLYGTLMKDNKYRAPDSTQKLRSAAVHEALHYDNPVLDQFLTDAQDEYIGTYLEQHITGSMLEGNRGVAATVGNGDLVFSGSFQRFTRATEDSQVFFDTLLQDPFDIAAAQNSNYSKNNLTKKSLRTLVNLHYFYTGSLEFTLNDLNSDGRISYAVSYDWKDSFPFEEKYSNVKRSLNRDISFLGKEVLDLCLEPPGFFKNTKGSETFTFDQTYGESLEKNYFLTNTINDTKFNGPGLLVLSIQNQAETYVNSGNSYFSYISIDKSIEKYRLFSSTIIGWGRQNRKQLDISSNDFSLQTEERWMRGASRRYHPAGFKYGYMNSDHLYPTTVHRGDRYGQFRDMLEQRPYGKVYSFGDEYTKKGELKAPVSCFFVDADGNRLDDPTSTQCLNLSSTMKSSKPFIEGEVNREITYGDDVIIIT